MIIIFQLHEKPDQEITREVIYNGIDGVEFNKQWVLKSEGTHYPATLSILANNQWQDVYFLSDDDTEKAYQKIKNGILNNERYIIIDAEEDLRTDLIKFGGEKDD